MKTKNYFKLILVMVFFILNLKTYGQVNLGLSPNATVTSSATSTFTPDKLNNGIISQCEFQEFWFTASGTNTTNWIQFTFTSNVDINTIKMFLGYRQTRYISAATIQTWDGSSWVDYYSYSVPFSGLISQACEYVVTFPRVNVDRFRITKLTISGNQTSNPSLREIQVYNLKGNDASMTKFFPVFGSGSTQVTAFMRNAGNTLIDSVNVGWTVNGTAQTGFKIKTKRPAFTFTDSAIDLGSYNFVSGTNYTIKAFTYLPNNALDSNMGNDTATYTFTAIGKPIPPTVNDQTYCGVSKPLLKGKGEAGTTLYWSKVPDGIPTIGVGDSIVLSTSLYPTDTVKYYARSLRSLNLNHTMAPLTGTWSFGGGTSPTSRGTFVNMKPKYNIIMDSILAAITVPNGTSLGPYNIRVWYREGRHNGVEYDSFQWTALATTNTTIQFTPLSQLPITPTALSAGAVQLKANTWYSFYYQIDDVANTVRTNCNGGTYQSIADTVFENEFLRVSEGALATGVFGSQGMIVGFIPESHYKCRLSLVSDSAIARMYIHPKPTGAVLLRAKNSNGTQRAGIESNFDYVTNGETISYALAPPTGYTNANFGVKWAITDLTISTKAGTNINMLDTVTSLPSATDSGRISITPRLSEVDSIFKIVIKLRDLGPYNCDSIIERWLYVAPRPVVNFDFNMILCDGDNVLFNNKSTIQSGVMSHKWYFRDVNNVLLDSSTSINPIYKFPTYGKYNITLISKNDIYGYTADTTIQITIGEIPLIKIKALNACEGIPVTFQNNTTVSTSTPAYLWNFGDGSPNSIDASPAHLYALPGGYQVKLVATAGGCSSEKVINAYQFARPVSKFTLPSGLACSGKPIKFTNQTTIPIGAAGAFWKFNDGAAVSTDQNPTHSFSTNGTYNIKLKSVSEFGCEDSISKPFVVNLGPKANFTIDKSCERENTQFTNTSTDKGVGYTTYWNFGDGTISFAENHLHTWTSTGKKNIVFAITSSSNCTDTLKRVMDILPQPVASFTAPVSCSGKDVSFENNSFSSSGNLTYLWDFSDGSTSNDGVPKHSYTVSQSSSFNVTLTVSVPGGCPASFTKSINIEPSPICGFSARDTFISPLGRGVYFKALDLTGTKYSWVLEGQGGNASKEFFHQFTYFRPYDVSLSVTNSAGCGCLTNQTVKFDQTSIKTIAEIGVSVYPNPTNDVVHVDGKDLSVINVFNVEGKLIYTSSNLSTNNVINSQTWAAGVYQIEIVSSKGNSVVKLVKY